MIGGLLAAAAIAAGLAPAADAAAPVARLSDDQLAGLRVVHGFSGAAVPRGLAERIRLGRAGGVILFSGNVPSRPALRALTRRLQALPRPAGLDAPLLVMVDQEGGLVRRVPGPPSRSASDLGAAGPRAARAAGRAAGRTLRGLGVNVNLAPVADVAGPGSALARDGRSFGARPPAVARAAAAFAAGLRAEGVAATAKHFPGLGAARVSTDDAPVVIRRSRTALRGRDMRPFAALVAAGVPMVMTSTAVYPALDPGRPASLSARTIGAELRGRLGFGGVVITDALDTPALATAGGPAAVAVRAAAAGADLVLFTSPAAGARARAAIARALRSGDLDRAEAQASAARVLRLRASLAARE